MAMAHDYRVMRSDRGFMCMVITQNLLSVIDRLLFLHPRMHSPSSVSCEQFTQISLTSPQTNKTIERD